MRSTTRQFCERVQAHILERLGNPWNECMECEIENATDRQKLENAIDAFIDYYNPYERRACPVIQKAFSSFLMGLPSCLQVEYTYHGMRCALAEWYEQTAEEAERYSPEEVEKQYLYLIFREFVKLCKKNGVDFWECCT